MTLYLVVSEHTWMSLSTPGPAVQQLQTQGGRGCGVSSAAGWGKLPCAGVHHSHQCSWGQWYVLPPYILPTGRLLVFGLIHSSPASSLILTALIVLATPPLMTRPHLSEWPTTSEPHHPATPPRDWSHQAQCTSHQEWGDLACGVSATPPPSHQVMKYMTNSSLSLSLSLSLWNALLCKKNMYVYIIEELSCWNLLVFSSCLLFFLIFRSPLFN